MAERAAVARLKQFISKNKLIKSLIGKGYNSTVTPYPIRKHLLQKSQMVYPLHTIPIRDLTRQVRIIT